jgi:hypothetical protein
MREESETTLNYTKPETTLNQKRETSKTCQGHGTSRVDYGLMASNQVSLPLMERMFNYETRTGYSMTSWVFRL